MRVFLTGATGYIGTVLTKQLIEGGHQVLGLARSEASAEQLEAMGAEVYRGDLDNLDSLAAGASAADAVIHTAMVIEDFNDMDAAFARDEKAVEAMLAPLTGTGKPFVYASGTGVLPDTGPEPADETLEADFHGPVGRRAALEQTILNAKDRDIRSVVIRPGIVYGNGGSGVWHMFAGLSMQAGAGRAIGDGTNVVSVVHVDDLADLFVRALERGLAGTLFNAASEEKPTMLEIATAVGRALNFTGPPSLWPVEEASAALGPFAEGMAANKRVSAARARDVLGWKPKAICVIDDLQSGSYPAAFAAAAASQS
ncbi:MAG: NAD-dependent epimerase/dehydratase family protein [Pseudomonadota bacterium]